MARVDAMLSGLHLLISWQGAARGNTLATLYSMISVHRCVHVYLAHAQIHTGLRALMARVDAMLSVSSVLLTSHYTQIYKQMSIHSDYSIF